MYVIRTPPFETFLSFLIAVKLSLMEEVMLCPLSFDSCNIDMCMMRFFMRSASSCIFVFMPSIFSCSILVVCMLWAIWYGGGGGVGLCGRSGSMVVNTVEIGLNLKQICTVLSLALLNRNFPLFSMV